MKIIPDLEPLAPRLAEFATACRFARAYADQNERDHAQLARAAAQGDIESIDD
jgi:hypothetical protein